MTYRCHRVGIRYSNRRNVMINHSEEMIAPCGVNCTYCYVHHKKKNQCLGCRIIDGNQPKSCRNCKIKNCIISKNYEFCYECEDFPCKLVKNLDKSYVKRYNVSLVKTLITIKNEGIGKILEEQKSRYRCSKCGSIINMHDKRCISCN